MHASWIHFYTAISFSHFYSFNFHKIRHRLLSNLPSESPAAPPVAASRSSSRKAPSQWSSSMPSRGPRHLKTIRGHRLPPCDYQWRAIHYPVISTCSSIAFDELPLTRYPRTWAVLSEHQKVAATWMDDRSAFHDTRGDKGHHRHFMQSPWGHFGQNAPGSILSLSLDFFPLGKNTKIGQRLKQSPTSLSVSLSSSPFEASEACVNRDWKRMHRRVSNSHASFVASSQRSLRRRLLLVPCSPELIFPGLYSYSIEPVPSFRDSDSRVMGNFGFLFDFHAVWLWGSWARE